MGGAEFEALWKRVVEDWDDERAHGAFLQHCKEHEILAEAATRYAGMRGDRERGANAQKRVEAVSVLAANALYATRTEATLRVPSWLVVSAAVFFGAMVLYVLVRLISG